MLESESIAVTWLKGFNRGRRPLQAYMYPRVHKAISFLFCLIPHLTSPDEIPQNSSNSQQCVLFCVHM